MTSDITFVENQPVEFALPGDGWVPGVYVKPADEKGREHIIKTKGVDHQVTRVSFRKPLEHPEHLRFTFSSDVLSQFDLYAPKVFHHASDATRVNVFNFTATMVNTGNYFDGTISVRTDGTVTSEVFLGRPCVSMHCTNECGRKEDCNLDVLSDLMSGVNSFVKLITGLAVYLGVKGEEGDPKEFYQEFLESLGERESRSVSAIRDREGEYLESLKREEAGGDYMQDAIRKLLESGNVQLLRMPPSDDIIDTGS